VMVPAQDPDSWSTFGRIAIQAGPNRDGRVDDLARDKGATKRIDRGNSTQTGADRVGSARDGPGLSSSTRGTDRISRLATSNISSSHRGLHRIREDERTVKTAHLKPAWSNGPYEAGAFPRTGARRISSRPGENSPPKGRIH
jgi:hypothetical protein